MRQERLDVLTQEGENRDLVARVQIPLDLGQELVDAVTKLVENRQGLDGARSIHHRARQTQVRAQVCLDGHVALGGGASDITGAVEGVHISEDDRF